MKTVIIEFEDFMTTSQRQVVEGAILTLDEVQSATWTSQGNQVVFRTSRSISELKEDLSDYFDPSETFVDYVI